MWQMRTMDVDRGERVELLSDGAPIPFRRLYQLFVRDADFASWYTEVLCASRHDAFFWEHPALTLDSLEAPAELVLIGAPSLASARPDPGPFQAHFDRNPDADVVMFRNLGGDATLIAPRPKSAAASYAHLATFVRSAPREQVLSLWRRVGHAVLDSVGPSPIWVSTAGMGVPWLHVRIDVRPKYYRHAAYGSHA